MEYDMDLRVRCGRSAREYGLEFARSGIEGNHVILAKKLSMRHSWLVPFVMRTVR